METSYSYSTSSTMDPTTSLLMTVFYLGFAVLMFASMWRIYTKAGKPGWAAIVPIYNIIVWLEIINRPVWWIALYFVPFVNLIIAIMMYVELAKVFGKGGGFAVGMILLSPIFVPLLAFGDSRYTDPRGAAPGYGYPPAQPYGGYPQQYPQQPPTAPYGGYPQQPPAAPQYPQYPQQPPAPPVPPQE